MSAISVGTNRSDHHADGCIEGGRSRAADGSDHPHTAPLRRDRPVETVAPHRVGAPALHDDRCRALAAGAFAAAARLLAGGGARLPGLVRLFAVESHRSAPRAHAGTDRIAAAIVRAAGV